MIKSPFRLLMVGVIPFFLSGCFKVDITETLDFDGSSEVVIEMDMSGLYKIIDSQTQAMGETLSANLALELEEENFLDSETTLLEVFDTKEEEETPFIEEVPTALTQNFSTKILEPKMVSETEEISPEDFVGEVDQVFNETDFSNNFGGKNKFFQFDMQAGPDADFCDQVDTDDAFEVVSCEEAEIPGVGKIVLKKPVDEATWIENEDGNIIYLFSDTFGEDNTKDENILEEDLEQEEALEAGNIKGFSPDAFGMEAHYTIVVPGEIIDSGIGDIVDSQTLMIDLLEVDQNKESINSEDFWVSFMPSIPEVVAESKPTVVLKAGLNLVSYAVFKSLIVQGFLGKDILAGNPALFYDPVYKRKITYPPTEDRRFWESFKSAYQKLYGNLELVLHGVIINLPQDTSLEYNYPIEHQTLLDSVYEGYGHALFGGWNFMAFTPLMLNHRLSSVAGTCEILSLNSYQNESGQWRKEDTENFQIMDLASGYMMKVANDCFLSLPQPPENSLEAVEPLPVEEALVENLAEVIGEAVEEGLLVGEPEAPDSEIPVEDIEAIDTLEFSAEDSVNEEVILEGGAFDRDSNRRNDVRLATTFLNVAATRGKISGFSPDPLAEQTAGEWLEEILFLEGRFEFSEMSSMVPDFGYFYIHDEAGTEMALVSCSEETGDFIGDGTQNLLFTLATLEDICSLEGINTEAIPFEYTVVEI